MQDSGVDGWDHMSAGTQLTAEGVPTAQGIAEMVSCARTVWMEGMTPPWAMPTSTRAAVMPRVLCALRGVSRLPVDHSRNDTMSVTRPPYF